MRNDRSINKVLHRTTHGWVRPRDKHMVGFGVFILQFVPWLEEGLRRDHINVLLLDRSLHPFHEKSQVLAYMQKFDWINTPLEYVARSHFCLYVENCVFLLSSAHKYCQPIIPLPSSFQSEIDVYCILLVQLIIIVVHVAWLGYVRHGVWISDCPNANV